MGASLVALLVLIAVIQPILKSISVQLERIADSLDSLTEPTTTEAAKGGGESKGAGE